MKINKLTPWENNIKASINGIIDASRQGGPNAKYYEETSMIYFLDSGKQNPSVAKIIAKDEIKKQGFKAKLQFLNQFNSNNVSLQRQEFEDSFTKLYPETGKIRTKLIDAGRFSLDEVKQKASKLEKFFLGFKL